MESAAGVLRKVQLAMLAGVILYVVLGEFIAQSLHRILADPVFHAFSMVSITMAAATVVVRRTMVLPSEQMLRQRPDDHLGLSRWKAGYLILYTLSEGLAVFGLALRLTGFPLSNVWGFYLGGAVLLLFYSPRTPQAQLG